MKRLNLNGVLDGIKGKETMVRGKISTTIFINGYCKLRMIVSETTDYNLGLLIANNIKEEKLKLLYERKKTV